MRQLTSLDAQFLALEDDRTQGHVSALATYDPETAAGRKLDARLVRELVTERLHLLPTFRWRLVQVPLGLDHPYWVDDPSVDVDYHVRGARAALARRRPPAGRAGRADRRSTARPLAPALGDIRDPRSPRRSGRAAHEDAPRRGRWRLRRRGHGRSAGRDSGGARPQRPRHTGSQRHPSRREMLGEASPESRATPCAHSARRRELSHTSTPSRRSAPSPV